MAFIEWPPPGTWSKTSEMVTDYLAKAREESFWAGAKAALEQAIKPLEEPALSEMAITCGQMARLLRDLMMQIEKGEKENGHAE